MPKIKSKSKHKKKGKRYFSTEEWMDMMSKHKRKIMTDAQTNLIKVASDNGIVLMSEIPVVVEDNKYFIDLRVGNLNIAIEVDGLYHNELIQQKRDQIRTQNLHKARYNVLRISNADATNDIKAKEFIINVKKAINGEKQDAFKLRIPIFQID